ncbi:hypothetical protein SDC9_79974 [bioreactor metagenome]|uniref:Uncharacterized protein n=1 Tax=bioreactor metagenome TaxID=1076179 RepID=A0A644YYM0_9ZZZZ
MFLPFGGGFEIGPVGHGQRGCPRFAGKVLDYGVALVVHVEDGVKVGVCPGEVGKIHEHSRVVP